MSGSHNSRKGAKKGTKTKEHYYWMSAKARRMKSGNELSVEIKTGSILAFNPRK
jgi:hypothetical protein